MRVSTLTAEQNVSLIAAGCAFYGLLAMFPGTAALIAVFGLLRDPAAVAEELQMLQNVLPEEAYGIVAAQVNGLVNTGTQALTLTTIVSLGFALWSARAGTAALMRGLNAINHAPNRGGLRHYITALTLTICLTILAVIALLAIVISPVALAFLPLGPTTTYIVDAARWGIGLLAIVAAISLLYRFGPNRRGHRMSWITPGAFIATALWIVASVAFNIYLANFGNYNEVYGSLGAVIALLMWLYISTYLVLLGAALNVSLEQVRNAARARKEVAESPERIV